MSKDLISMAQQFTGLPMDSLIGGPLNAAAKANGAMAATQTKFLLDTCFSRPTDDNGVVLDNAPYLPIMISMELERALIIPGDTPGDAVIEPIITTFNLPILTILPLNSLAIDEVSVAFDMEVKSSYGEEESDSTASKLETETSFETKIGFGCFSASVQGSVSYSQENNSTRNSHYDKSNNAKYSVNVHAGQLPLPLGVTTIIQAFTSAIEPIQMPKKVTDSDSDTNSNT